MSVKEIDSEQNRPELVKRTISQTPPNIALVGGVAEPQSEQQVQPHAIDALREAAANALLKSWTSIADGMVRKSEEGDVRCARFLCDLADQSKELAVAQQKRAKRSLATEWANEPEWSPDLDGQGGCV